MSFVNLISIAGPTGDIDRLYDNYLSKYDIHLEYAPAELQSSKNLTPYVEQNPYKEVLSEAAKISKIYKDIKHNHETDIKVAIPENKDEAIAFINTLSEALVDSKIEIDKLEKELASLQESHDKIAPFKNLEYDIEDILNFVYIKFRFGRIPLENWSKLESYIYKDQESIFTKCTVDNRYVWGVYFVPHTLYRLVDAEYTSLQFERTFIPGSIEGNPEEACNRLMIPINNLKQAIKAARDHIEQYLATNKAAFDSALSLINAANDTFEIRKYAACTNKDGVMYYFLCGWMTSLDADKLSTAIESNETSIICFVDDEKAHPQTKPPTKLKNPSFFKPFEMFVKMYGLPSYNEIDPTMFVALTYAFIFGAMFGDLGQGLVLMIGGYLLYKKKKAPLFGIIASAGFFSSIFGVLFGSIFGYEHLIPALWLRPVTHMSNVPFVGKLNTVFVLAIGFGMFLILVSILLHIYNAIKARDIENIFFDTNGLAGLVFYASLVSIILLFMTNNPIPGGIVLFIMFVVPLIIIAFKEPLTHFITKRENHNPQTKGVFITQAIFEVFEVLLSYFSNTLSFVRIGAFAVSHVAMMEVVLMLAGATHGETGNLVVIILGNIIVSALEGLIVGIQVLRLEYYELFSRYYKGGGKEFKPYTKK